MTIKMVKKELIKIINSKINDLLGKTSRSGASVLDEAGRMAAQAVHPMDDLHGAADYKEHLVLLFLHRVFAEAVGEAPSVRRSAA